MLEAKKILSPEAAGNILGFGLIIACVAIAIVLVIVTRGRLGYARYKREAEDLDLHPAESGTEGAAASGRVGNVE